MADQNDYTQNVNIWNDAKSKAVSIITDGAIERLAVDAAFPITTPTIGNVSALTSSGKMYTVAVSVNLASASLDNPIILIKNPTSNTKRLYLYKVNLGCDVANVNINFKLFHTPTISNNGSVLTPVNLFIGGGFPASSLEVYQLSTISVSGTIIQTYGTGQNTSSYDGLQDFSIQVSPNSTILLTGKPSSNNRLSIITMVWAEV